MRLLIFRLVASSHARVLLLCESKCFLIWPQFSSPVLHSPICSPVCLSRAGKSNPYCEVTMGDQVFTSRTLNDTVNPKWNFNCQFHIRDVYQDVLCITIYERDLFAPDGQSPACVFCPHCCHRIDFTRSCSSQMQHIVTVIASRGTKKDNKKKQLGILIC